MMLVMVEMMMTVYVVTCVSCTLCRYKIGNCRDDDGSVMLLQVCHVEMMLAVYVITGVSCRDDVGDGRDDDDSVMLLQVCHVEMVLVMVKMMITVLCCYRCVM